MSDSPRSRRPQTKTADRIDPVENKKARDELRQLHERADDSRRSASGVRRSWDKFDDLPEQGLRQVLPGGNPAAAPVRNQRGGPPPAPRMPPQPARELLDDAPQRSHHAPLAESGAMLHHTEMTYGSNRRSLPPPPLYNTMRRMPWVMAVVIILSVTVLAVLYMQPSKKTIGTVHEPAPQGASIPAAPAAPAPNGEHSILRAPSLTADQIDEVLREYGSPAAGTGRDWVELGQKYGIDPAYGLAFFVVESTAGTAQGWAGWKPDGSSTHNIGNIICAGYDTCYGRFRDYHNWREGIEDWYKLISVEYVGGRGLQTVEQIIPVYAPSFENDVQAYVGNVERMVAEWRTK